MSNRIPTIMYHSIGIINKNWHWNFLTCPLKTFENQLKWLKKTGYKTLNFQEVYDAIINDKPFPKDSVFLTFDDGYLDNYVFVYPLLKKYGMKGTIFVNPDFVDTSIECRKTLSDIDSESEISELQHIGFCNWAELRKMDSEGVLDVQSHAKTHTWYEISDEIVDFRHPEDDYIWMDWNNFPKNKPYLQCIDRDKVKLGTAVFKHEKALSSKRVFINSDFQNEMNKYVEINGGLSFYEKTDWKKELLLYSDELRRKYNVIIKSETQKEYLERIEFELKFTKEKLEKELNKIVSFICWPGGSATTEGVKIADKLGYLMSTAAEDIPELRKKIINSPTQKINRISRITPVMYDNWNKDNPNSVIKYSPGWFYITQLLRFQNKYYAGFWAKLIHYLIFKWKKYV